MRREESEEKVIEKQFTRSQVIANEGIGGSGIHASPIVSQNGQIKFLIGLVGDGWEGCWYRTV